MGKAISRARIRYDNRSSGKPLEVNDLIWLFTPRIPVGASKKFHNPWTGPWKITKILTPVVFEILTIGCWSANDITTVVGLDRIKRYHVDETKSSLDKLPPKGNYSPEDFEIDDEFLESPLEPPKPSSEDSETGRKEIENVKKDHSKVFERETPQQAVAKWKLAQACEDYQEVTPGQDILSPPDNHEE